MSTHLLQEGKTISNKWHVERFLGEGAFAEVYRVRHKIFGRQAMKVFKRIGMKLEEVEEILQEPVLLAGINHPNIIRVFDADTTETFQGICCFFTMEYVAGGTLERFWRSFGNRFVPIQNVVDLITQVATGLSLAHSNDPPIVHRDIKPQNVLVGYDNIGLRARIADFGLAKKFNVLTMALTGLGTKFYKPPEVLANLKNDSPAGDIWAIGTCFYLLLTDRFPFANDSDLEVLDAIRFERPLVPPSKLNVSVDEYLDELVCRCLALNPAERFSNARELTDALQRWRPRNRNRTKPIDVAQFSDIPKNALGSRSSPNEQMGKSMAKEALDLSRYVGKLNEAADLMEEAFNNWPSLRKEFEYKVTIWRKGISG
ncbi:MAG: serine/threonine-protein kinase [Candidatus Manganitrophaceae bacterium]